MCRMFLSTYTSATVSPILSRLIADRCMVQHTGEEQEDGYGFTDGMSLIKSGSMYTQSPLYDFHRLNFSRPLMGHTRSASPGTHISINGKESQPFRHGNGFAAHNGSFAPWFAPKDKDKDHVPVSDTYYALSLLLDMPNHHDYEVWLEKFNTNSKFVLFFYREDDSFDILRGKGEREMYFLKVGDGLLFLTSAWAAYSIREWLAPFDIELGDATYYVPENTRMHVARPGTHEYTLTRLDYDFKPVYDHVETIPFWRKLLS
jgi:hypothetical protein